MSPELEQKLKEMSERIESLESVQQTEFIEQIDDQLILQEYDVTDSNVTNTISIPDGGGSANTFDFPDRWLMRRYKGKVYLIPAYELDKR